jgi:hypothetical protein
VKKSAALAALAALAAIIFVAPPQAHATGIFSTGFEPATYSPGPLLDQDGWYGSTNMAVQTGTVNAGTQAVAITASAAGADGSYHSLAYDSVGNPENIVTVSIDIRLNSVTDPNVVWEGLGLLGNAGFVTQTLVYGGTGTACAVSCSGVPLDPNTWNTLSLQLDFSTHTVSHFLNGVLFSSDSFATNSTSLSSVAIGINNAGGTSPSTAYFDSLSVVSSVAEPPSLALLGGALLLLGAITTGRKRLGLRHSA